MADGVHQALARLRAVTGDWTRDTPLAAMRARWDTLFDPPPAGTAIEAVSCDGVPAEWIGPPGARPVILFLHGGGHRIGSPRSHRGLVAMLAAATGCRALCPAYRLAPEHRFPAGLEDCRAAYAWLRGQVPAAHIALAGDSAGGGLALSVLVALRDAGEALPAAAAVMSAWTDLTASGPSYEARAGFDPLNARPALLAMARSYLNGADPRLPLASPLFADLAGLPPLLMQVGGNEIVHSDTALFAERARAAGVDATVQEWGGMFHVFQQFPAELPQAADAIGQAARFLRRHLGLSEGTPA